MTVFVQDVSAACSCYAAAAALVQEVKLLGCSAKEEFLSVRAAKNSCIDKFRECKQAEDSTIGLIWYCLLNLTQTELEVEEPSQPQQIKCVKNTTRNVGKCKCLVLPVYMKEFQTCHALERTQCVLLPIAVTFSVILLFLMTQNVEVMNID